MYIAPLTTREATNIPSTFTPMARATANPTAAGR